MLLILSVLQFFRLIFSKSKFAMNLQSNSPVWTWFRWLLRTLVQGIERSCSRFLENKIVFLIRTVEIKLSSFCFVLLCYKAGVTNLFHKWAKILKQKPQRAKILIHISFSGQKCIKFEHSITDFSLQFSFWFNWETSKGHSGSPGGPKMARGPRVGHPCYKVTINSR